MKAPRFADVIEFEGIGPCYFTIINYRPPKRGEWYLSGAIITGYWAPSDLTTAYWVVKPTFHAKHVSKYEKGDAVRLTPGGVPLPRKPV